MKDDSSSYGAFLIVYGSQTGQSKAISEIFVDRAEKLGLNPRLHELNDFGKKFHIEEEPLVAIVCSSTGSGDPPDNAARFFRWISRASHPEGMLKTTNFALLGLGDSNFSTYQGAPRFLERHLIRLGATRLIETGVADDQVGLELAVEPWLDKVLDRLVEWFREHSEAPENVTGLKAAATDIKEKGSQLSSLADDLDRVTFVKMSEAEDMSCEEEQEEEEEIKEVILKSSKVVWPEDRVCLVKGAEALRCDQDLRVPVPTTTYLASRVTHEKFNEKDIQWQNGCPLPGATNEIIDARVVGTIEMTAPEAAKGKRELQIDVGDAAEKLKYEPGDAFYFIVPNPREEVNFILERMNLLAIADQKCIVCVHPRTEKKNATMPGYIPATSSLRYIFTYCLDIRRSPGRPLLRYLAELTKKEEEKRRLMELCSAQGVNEFTEHIRQAGISLADLLFAFPSCRPSADRLLELLPRLQPRPYSVASSPLSWGRRIRFIYSLLEFPVGEGRYYRRYGLASEWLASLKTGDHVKVMLKEPAKFRLPPPALSTVDLREIPLILVGPGTGVAPFLYFLQHIFEKNLADNNRKDVERELYFGCRRLDVDCICRSEMEAYLREKVLSHLEICESQPKPGSESGRPKYVQDALTRRGEKVAKMLTHVPSDGKQAVRVYVCGDAKGMSKDVWAAFIAILVQHTGKSEDEAKQFMEQLKTDERYLEDVWA